MSNVFQKIIAGELPAYKIYEDEEFLAFLDIFPTHKGQTIVVPKVSVTAKFSQTDATVLQKLVAVGQKVAQQIESKLPAVERCQVVIEGFDIDHLHLKLYPAFLPEPRAYVVTQGGEKASDTELKALQKLLTAP